MTQALATLLARTPDLEPHDDGLDLGATLKPTVRRAASGTLRLDRGEYAPGDANAASRQPAGYDILGELGRGGIGVVYRARQRTLQREVALKRLQAGDEPLRRAFLAESMVTGELEHPNIVPVYALCEEDQGELWLVMKRIGGRTLAQLLADEPLPRDPRAIDRLLDVILDVGDALRFAHSRGILHRDIKPVNVMVGTFGEVMLLDWGIAARFSDGPEAAASVPHVRDLDMIAGTPLYMPPEMAEGRGEDSGPWTDVYLLGATLYEVITGRPPRGGGSLWDALSAASQSTTLAFGPDVPLELQQICRRALAHHPESRYPDVDSFQSALRDFLEHRESRALVTRAEEGFTRWQESAARGDEAQRAKVYRGISEIISSYQHALVLWPGNDAARAGEVIARRAWAKTALDNGDLAVAANAIECVGDAKANALRKRIDAVRLERSRTLRFARWLGAGLMAGQLLLVIGLGAFGWVEARRFTRGEILEELQRLAPAAAAALTMVDEFNRDSLDEVADALGRQSELHLVLLEAGGTVIADSDSEPGDPPPPVRAWPEVMSVLRGSQEAWAEHLGAGNQDVLSLARRWHHDDGTQGVLVLSLPRNTLDGSLHSILIGGFVALLVSFLVWSLVIVRVSRRLSVALSRFL